MKSFFKRLFGLERKPPPAPPEPPSSPVPKPAAAAPARVESPPASATKPVYHYRVEKLTRYRKLFIDSRAIEPHMLTEWLAEARASHNEPYTRTL